MADGSVTIEAKFDEKQVQSEIKRLDSIVEKGMKGALVSIGAITTAIAGIGASALKFGTEYQQASNQLQASTGATAEEMDNLKEVMKNIYANNLGEDMNDVANSLATVRKELGDLDDTSLQNATQSAIALRDTFDYDVSESVRSAKALMDNFGISSEEAFNLIVQGAQNGLDYSGELLDTISEYSVQFSKLGFSAEDMFNILQEGTETGAFNLDKVGDAIKEFSIRAIDGSNTTIDGFTRLGLNAEEMATKFAIGGDTARDAFNEVIERIGGMDDKVEQSIVGVDLFGTMWEDLGPEVVTQLSNISGAYDQTVNSAEKLTQIKYDDLGSAIQGIGRQIQTNLLLPIGEKLLPTFNNLANKLSEALASPEMQTAIDNIANSVGGLVTSIASFAEKWLPSIINLVSWIIQNAPTIISLLAGIATGMKVFQIGSSIANFVSGFKNASTAVQGVSGAFKAFNAVLKANPIILIISVVASLIAILITLWNTNEDFRNAVINIWNGIKETVGNVVNGIILFFTETIPTAFNNFITTVSNFITSVIDWFKNLPYNLGLLIGQVIGHIVNLGLRFVEFVTKDVPNFINGVVNWFKQLPGKIWTWLTNTINNIVNWGRNMVNKGKQAASDLVSNVVNTIKNLPSQMLEIGKNIVQGIWDGIKNAGSWLINKVKEFASGILDGIKQTLGIHSPSVVFKKEVGRNIALGIGEGFEDSIDKVYKQMKSTVDFETQRLSANLSTTASVNRNLTANITTQPSNVYLDGKKVGRIVTPGVTRTLKLGGAH